MGWFLEVAIFVFRLMYSIEHCNERHVSWIFLKRDLVLKIRAVGGKRCLHLWLCCYTFLLDPAQAGLGSWPSNSRFSAS